MIVNFHSSPLSLDTMNMIGGRVLVDGREVVLVHYADDKRGIVKTYDVLGDGKPHASVEVKCPWWTPEDFPGRTVECPAEGALSETLWGKVEFIPPERETK